MAKEGNQTLPGAEGNLPAGEGNNPPGAGEGNNPPGAGEGGESKFKVPETFSSEKWAKDIDSEEKLWVKLAGAEKLIGRARVAVPGENASPEEIAQFNMSIGVPKSAEDYVFKTSEKLPQEERNTEYDKGLAQIAHEVGLPKDRFEKFMQRAEEFIYEKAEPMRKEAETRTLAQQKVAQDFEATYKEIFGEDDGAGKQQFITIMQDVLGDKKHLANMFESDDPTKVVNAAMMFSKMVYDQFSGESKQGRTNVGITGNGDLKTQYHRLSGEKLRIRDDASLNGVVKSQKLAELNKQMMHVGAKAAEKGIDLFS